MTAFWALLLLFLAAGIGVIMGMPESMREKFLEEEDGDRAGSYALYLLIAAAVIATIL